MNSETVQTRAVVAPDRPRSCPRARRKLSGQRVSGRDGPPVPHGAMATDRDTTSADPNRYGAGLLLLVTRQSPVDRAAHAFPLRSTCASVKTLWTGKERPRSAWRWGWCDDDAVAALSSCRPSRSGG